MLRLRKQVPGQLLRCSGFEGAQRAPPTPCTWLAGVLPVMALRAPQPECSPFDGQVHAAYGPYLTPVTESRGGRRLHGQGWA